MEEEDEKEERDTGEVQSQLQYGAPHTVGREMARKMEVGDVLGRWRLKRVVRWASGVDGAMGGFVGARGSGGGGKKE